MLDSAEYKSLTITWHKYWCAGAGDDLRHHIAPSPGADWDSQLGDFRPCAMPSSAFSFFASAHERPASTCFVSLSPPPRPKEKHGVHVATRTTRHPLGVPVRPPTMRIAELRPVRCVHDVSGF